MKSQENVIKSKNRALTAMGHFGRRQYCDDFRRRVMAFTVVIIEIQRVHDAQKKQASAARLS
jgi:hypothetical protein